MIWSSLISILNTSLLIFFFITPILYIVMQFSGQRELCEFIPSCCCSCENTFPAFSCSKHSDTETVCCDFLDIQQEAQGLTSSPSTAIFSSTEEKG